MKLKYSITAFNTFSGIFLKLYLFKFIPIREYVK